MIRNMLSAQEIADIADPRLEQHFLVSPSKLAQIIAAAEIRPTDNVIEVGAGIGTVAQVLPPSASLTVIELDGRFTELLRKHVPNATAMQGDALELVQKLPCDVLLSNLPTEVTERMLSILPQLSFRVAVLAVGEATDLSSLADHFTLTEVTTITGNDFIPPQRGVSRIVCAMRRSQG
jgi:protein-L-isoaspartate O-methyltransferase